MKAAIDAGKIGRPALGVFHDVQLARRRPTTSPTRGAGKWDTEGGGVLVNQSPHQLDLLLWFMGPAAEVSGYWANVNHPTVEVDDTAVAIDPVPERRARVDRRRACAQKPGIYTKVHVHGSNGASVGVETDRGATFIAGVSGDRRAAAQRPLDHPRRGAPAGRVPGRGPRPHSPPVDATTHYHALQIADFLAAIRDGRPPLVTGEDGRAVVELFTAIYRSSREGRPVRI